MKKILSLCINLLLLIISDAVPLKLIAGDRSVVKKDGATHTISKYYAVPNDYDIHNSKSMGFGSTDEEISENKATTVNHQSDDEDDDSDVTIEKNNNQVNFRRDRIVGQGEITKQPDDSTESTVSLSTEQTLDSDDLGNLQVAPIINPINISHIVTNDEIDTNVNSGKAVQNGSAFIVDDVTDYQNIEDTIDDLILKKFGIAVRDIYSKNLQDFWKLIKIIIDKELGDHELLATIEQLSLLLNIFTNLHEAAQMQQPIEKMIDLIVEILQKPFVEKSKLGEYQAETDISGNNDEECLRKCGQRSFNPQLDSNSTYLSETEASDSSELNNLQRIHIVDSDDNDLIKMSKDPDSNQVTVSNEPKNVLRRQLPVPYNLNVGVPDGYDVLSWMTTPTLNDVARYDQEDPSSIKNIVKSRFDDVLPLTNKSITADDLPWTIEEKTTEYFTYPITTTPNDGLTWHIEDKTSGYYPSIIKHRTYNKVPWNTESKPAPTWTIKNKMRHLPVTILYQSSDSSVTAHGGNILLNPNQSIKSTVHSVKNGIKKPYHIYRYVIKPTATLYKVPNVDNVVQMNHLNVQPYENLETTLYDLPTLQGGNKVVYKNLPPQSHYESQYSLSKPTIDVSRQQETQPNSGEEKEAPTFPKIDSPPGDLLMNIPSNPFESPINLGYTAPVSTASASSSSGDPTNVNIDIDDRFTNSNYTYDNEDRASAHSSVQTSQYPGLISVSAASSAYTNGLDEPVYGGQEYQQPGAISTASASSKYTTVQNDNDVPTLLNGGDTNNYPGYIADPVYGGQVYQQPGAIAIASANSKYTTVQNDNDVTTQVHGGHTNNYPGYIADPVYGGQVYQQPGAIAIASANSKYTTVQNDNDVPTQVHGGHTNNYPGYIADPVYGGQEYQQPGTISIASANSKYTTVQNDNDVPTQVHGGHTNIYPGYITDPVYGGQVYQQPGTISIASANSKYTTVQNDNDVPTQVHGGHTNNYPGYIYKATAHSEYTNVPIDYGHDTNTQPGLISEVHQHPVYPNVVDDFDDSIPVNGLQILKYPGYISKASAQYVPDYADEVNHYIKVNPVNGGPTQNGNNYLVPYQPYGHTVHVIHRPSLIETISGNQNLKLAPTYQLFTLQNLQNLKNAIIKTIQMPGYYNDRALINLKNIINVILLLAENLEESDGNNAWYKKIFYNSEHSQHPLHPYVYRLIRQRWLHELMLVMYKNNFSINIFQKPEIFSFLESWQFPEYVQNFMEAEELIHVPNLQNHNDISNNQNKFSIQTYDDLLEVPVGLAKYATKNVIDRYKTPNEGIVLSIAGVEGKPDANAIVNILQYYLYYKNYIEAQENGITHHDNKVEMLNQIILFLREKGYGPNTIADLIWKLYTAVYSPEGKSCKTDHTNFAKKMYDVILPVLRRSGR